MRIWIMSRALRRSLVVSWTALGTLAGAALSSPMSRWILLLVPVVLIAAWLLWNERAGRESAAALIGIASCPALVAVRARDAACPLGGDFASCEPVNVLPWVLGSILLVLVGSALLLTPAMRGRQRPHSLAYESKSPRNR